MSHRFSCPECEDRTLYSCLGGVVSTRVRAMRVPLFNVQPAIRGFLAIETVNGRAISGRSFCCNPYKDFTVAGLETAPDRPSFCCAPVWLTGRNGPYRPILPPKPGRTASFSPPNSPPNQNLPPTPTMREWPGVCRAPPKGGPVYTHPRADAVSHLAFSLFAGKSV